MARCFPHVQCECAAEQGGAGQHGMCGDRGGTGRAGTAICRVGAPSADYCAAVSVSVQLSKAGLDSTECVEIEEALGELAQRYVE